MHIRLFQPADVSALTTIHVLCNRTDAFSRFCQPGMDDYPVSHRLAYLRAMQRGLRKPGVMVFVAETNESDYEAGATANATPSELRPGTTKPHAPEVVGFIMFGRNGTSAVARDHQRQTPLGPASTLSHRLDTGLLSLEQKYYNLFASRLNPSYNAQNWNLMLPRLFDFDPELFAESFGVHLFFVHPDWQRRGIGKKLMAEVLKRADEEKVPIRVCGAALGGAAYRSCGFRSLTRIGEQPFYDELEFGGEAPQAWVWEPEIESVGEGKWFEKAREKIEKEKGEKKMVKGKAKE